MSPSRLIEVGRMDELGRMNTPLHQLDARTKIITTMIFIVTVMSFPRYEISALIPLFLYPFLLTAMGNLPLGYLAGKIAIAAPFALLVGIWNPFLDTKTLWQIGSFPVSGGWLSLCSILIRFILTVSTALILVATTGMYRLCAGLEQLGMPRVFSVQLLFLYRYLSVITEQGVRMTRSVAVRSASPHPLRWTFYGPLVGHLLLRSMNRAQRIYQAMLARGFKGEIHTLQSPATGIHELLFAALWMGFFFCARRWNLSVSLGNLLTGVIA